MRISSSLFTNNLLAQMNNLQSQQTQLQGEVSSGLSVTLPEDNPGAMDQALNLQSQASANTQYQNNITQLQSTATTAGDAMNNLQTIAEQAADIATEANTDHTSTQLTAYAVQVGSLIQEALQAANTQDTRGNYVFAGSINNQPPFVAQTDSSGNVTSVSYKGNTDTPASQIGPNLTVSAVTPGGNTTGSGPAGLLVDSSSGADLFSHLISLQQDLISGNTANITSTDSPNLTVDENSIVSGIAANGVVQATLQSAATAASQLGNSLTSQTSNLTGADMATTLTNLDQVETSLQAAMQSGVMIMNLSIMDFLQ
jgi:flagellar hook-associated protein 3 FlgL